MWYAPSMNSFLISFFHSCTQVPPAVQKYDLMAHAAYNKTAQKPFP